MNEPKSYWISQAEMACSLGISLSAFQKWNVKPVEKIGRKVYYMMADVITNRLDHAAFGSGSDLLEFAPGAAEHVRRRIAGLEAQLLDLKAKLAASR